MAEQGIALDLMSSNICWPFLKISLFKLLFLHVLFLLFFLDQFSLAVWQHPRYILIDIRELNKN